MYHQRKKRQYITVLPKKSVVVQKFDNKTYDEITNFYYSNEWKECRQDFISKSILFCKGCNGDLSGNNKKYINVDHIKPLRYFWDLRLDQSNLQLLCAACNKAKGSKIEGMHYENGDTPFTIQHKSDWF